MFARCEIALACYVNDCYRLFMTNEMTLKGFATDVDCPTCPARKYVPCTHRDCRVTAPCEARVERAYRAEVRRGEHKAGR